MNNNNIYPIYPIHYIVSTFTQFKNGFVFEPNGSGKKFTKMAGVLVAPDTEAFEWIRLNVSPEFFNEYVVKILYASPDRFSRNGLIKHV